MPRTDTTQAAVNAARATLATDLFNFATGTFLTDHNALAAAVVAMDPQHPQLGGSGSAPKVDRLSRALVQFLNECIADGSFSGKPVRYP